MRFSNENITLGLPNFIMQFYNPPFNIKNKRVRDKLISVTHQKSFLFLSVYPFCLPTLHLQRRNAWAHVFRTCSSLMICHRWRLWRCSPASPASSRTPVTCHRPCWTISECARVTPSSAISCSGTP